MRITTGSKREFHPFGHFLPKKCRFLLLGSFVAKNATVSEDDSQYNWFFSTKRNQFWPIMEKLYGGEYKTKKQKQDLFKRLNLAFADTIVSCKRSKNNSADTNLTDIVINEKVINNILYENNIEVIYFTSRFVENIYKKYFKRQISLYPKIKLITLPSPSPRYARISFTEKIKIYRTLMPTYNAM